MTEQRKAVIKNADMSEDMQQDAVDCASQALSKYNIEKVRQTNPWIIVTMVLEEIGPGFQPYNRIKYHMRVARSGI
jgi:hypothetical protein